MSNRKWYHVTTRLFGLFEIQLANEVYPKFPLKKGGFNLDTVIIGKNGIIERYVDEDQLNELHKLVKNNDYKELLNGFGVYERDVITVLKKLKNHPLKNRQEFMLIFRKLWVHEITAFFIGLYCEDQETIDIISNLRGTKSAQHVAISDFLPKLFNEIAKNLKIDVELLNYALPDEIISLKLDPKILSLRRKLYILELIKGSLRLLVGKNAKNFVENFTKNIKNVINKNIMEFKGTPAYPGEASGKVVLVTRESDLIKVNKGDILVSPMTRTSFVSAMKKTAAFITDEGGITCHAAIIARELKKPCIVGTKIASKILKNGMLIKINANTGLITIIKDKKYVRKI